jgi:hypothetical protein
MNPLHNINNLKTYVPFPGSIDSYWEVLKLKCPPPDELVLVPGMIFARSGKRGNFGCVFLVADDGVVHGHGGNTVPFEIAADEFHATVIPKSIALINYHPPLLAYTKIDGYIPIGQQPDQVIVLTA